MDAWVRNESANQEYKEKRDRAKKNAQNQFKEQKQAWEKQKADHEAWGRRRGEHEAVENQKAEPIHVVVYGERALAEVDPRPQTLDAPGRYVGIGLTTMFGFDDDGFVRRSDGRYAVYWITVKGEGADRHIGERGTLELAR